MNEVLTQEPTPSRGWPFLPPLALLTGVIGLWAILFIAIPPWAQDFPLNDDWAFARGAFGFARGDGIHYQHWSSMPQLGQWLWAWPFIQVLGEHHTALRFATVVLSLLGILAFFDLLRQAGLAPARAAFASACLAFNPLYFELSGTFLTDVPTLAFSLIALALYARAFALASTNVLKAVDVLALAVIVAILGAINRQNAITVPMAAGLVMLRYRSLRLRSAWLLAIAIPAGVALAAHFFAKAQPGYYTLPAREEIDLGRIVLLVFAIIHYMGLATLPVLIFDADLRSWKRPLVLMGFAAALLTMAGGAVFYAEYHHEENALRDWWKGWADNGFWSVFHEESQIEDRFPYLGNMLTPWGQFDNVQVLFMGERPLVLGRRLRLAVSILGCVAGAALLVRGAARMAAGAWKAPLTIFSVLHVPFLLLPLVLFDRYLIVFLPGALYLATNPRVDTAPSRLHGLLPRRVLGLAALALFGFFSLCLIHDWLAWNAARWALGERALERGIAREQIDGGFEWSSWQAGSPHFLDNVRYALSFSVPQGARAIDQEPYHLWLAPGQRTFYLIEPPRPEARVP